mmetsp:Transcript_12480/g.53485  ORF Transcript_12480/g.53485 Transcript_12480/m.53485 type:complete len:205 (-) Transcript_12480:2242-2856(-)
MAMAPDACSACRSPADTVAPTPLSSQSTVTDPGTFASTSIILPSGCTPRLPLPAYVPAPRRSRSRFSTYPYPARRAAPLPETATPNVSARAPKAPAPYEAAAAVSANVRCFTASGKRGVDRAASTPRCSVLYGLPGVPVPTTSEPDTLTCTSQKRKKKTSDGENEAPPSCETVTVLLTHGARVPSLSRPPSAGGWRSVTHRILR